MKLSKQDEIGVWADIEGYKGLYQMTSDGRFRRLPSAVNRNGFIVNRKGGEIKAVLGNAGYYLVNLYKNGKGRLFLVHRLLGIHFLKGQTDKRIEINHINSIRSDNRLENLEWVTPSENITHGYKTGFCKRFFGAEHWRSKPVVAEHKTTKEIIEFNSATEALKYFSMPSLSNAIWKLIKSGGFSRKGFRFYYKKQFIESIKQ